MTIKSGAAAKTQCFPFIFNEAPCGPAAVVVAITGDDNHKLLFLDSILETSVWGWDQFSFAAAPSHGRFDTNTNTVSYTTLRHTMGPAMLITREAPFPPLHNPVGFQRSWGAYD